MNPLHQDFTPMMTTELHNNHSNYTDMNIEQSTEHEWWINVVEQSTEHEGWINVEPISFVDDRSVCLPSEAGNSSVMLSILRSFPDRAKDERKSYSFSGFEALDAYMDAYFILRPLEQQKARIFAQHHHQHRNQGKKFSSTGNFFTILDKAGQSAIAFSGAGQAERSVTNELFKD
ncbi:hypothetical protein KIN20_031811 [Parelaphostrongylus tenuis]|uniref:Uncharacterized protein n=1 Tax=Parelaphostrongylus tenuis TaxID=148309 RepID=A0AAD5R602_PARTN|nr:hypothetical protein KIN20_031811 [Parelaphostrongylus tenuis]